MKCANSSSAPLTFLRLSWESLRLLTLVMTASAFAPGLQSRGLSRKLSMSSIRHRPTYALCMVMSLPDKDTIKWSNAREMSLDGFKKGNKETKKRRVRQKYKRKRIPATEREHQKLQSERQAKYEQIVSTAEGECPSLWSFEMLFPKPVWDEATIKRDLYEVKLRDEKTKRGKSVTKERYQQPVRPKLKTASIGGNSMMRIWRDPKVVSNFLAPSFDNLPPVLQRGSVVPDSSADVSMTSNERISSAGIETLSERLAAQAVSTNSTGKVDFQLTRMVEDRMFGYRRGGSGYSTSLMDDGAIKFREGVRLSNPLPVNAARLNYLAKKELRKDRVEEAKELYEEAIRIDPADGRAYLGLSRCAERRRDFKLAREVLRAGIATCVSFSNSGSPDRGANPFLLQALGCLEEKSGHLAQAEALYIASAKSRPSHAAAWVALAQLRTRKFRQGVAAGRVCYQTAERELANAGMPPSSHVYTAWAALEYKKAGDVNTARSLYKKALKIDKKCSAAWLQLGVMEADNENWKNAEECFQTVLKFDQRNSRVLQAYAIMETRRPGADSRKAIGLFERALKVNPRDGGVLQPYALFVASLGDIGAARDLLRRGTEVDKRHAPVWQAWGVLETTHGTAEEARSIFQQGIWACAQLSGGQSGGYKCARLWQAWGVLEAHEGDYAAARRCFSRALDSDSRSLAAITAWTQMEEQIGNLNDAALIFERALKQFASGTEEKSRLWRAYELMEQRAGNSKRAQEVYSRSMRETFDVKEEKLADDEIASAAPAPKKDMSDALSNPNEVEVVRWDTGSSMKSEVWMNNGSIEGKVPDSVMGIRLVCPRQQDRPLDNGA